MSQPTAIPASLSFIDEKVLRDMLASLDAVTGHSWSITPPSPSELDSQPPLPGTAIEICAEGEVVCLLRCLSAGLSEAHLALARSTAALVAALLQQHMTTTREQLHRIATEAALTEQNKRLLLLAEYLPVLIHAHDAQGRYIFWNKECERTTGYSAAQMLGGTFQGVSWLYSAYEDPSQKFEEMHDHNAEYRDKELTLRCADGQFKTFAWTNISKRCPIPGWDCWEVGIDITPRKKAEQALQEQLQLIETLLEAVPYPLYIKDTKLQYIGCNEAFSAFSGLSEEALRGKTSTDLWGETDAAHIEAHDRAVLAAQGRESWEGRLRDADGAMRDVMVVKGVFRGHDGGVRGLVCVLSDVTAQKHHEHTLLSAKRQAEEASQAKTRFLANVSHELRTPLNGILGATELLQGEDLTADQIDLLGMVRSSTNSLLHVLNDLLDLASLEQGSLTIAPQPGDMHRFFESLCKLFAVQANWKHLDFTWRIAPDTPRRCMMDSQRLRQAVTNCFWNALKYTKQGSISLHISPGGAPQADAEGVTRIPLCIEIRDTGVGISPEQQERIFEAFTLAENVLTKAHGGLGLGLAISHKLTTLMGGRMWVESSEGEGTVFYMLIPMELV